MQRLTMQQPLSCKAAPEMHRHTHTATCTHTRTLMHTCTLKLASLVSACFYDIQRARAFGQAISSAPNPVMAAPLRALATVVMLIATLMAFLVGGTLGAVTMPPPPPAPMPNIGFDTAPWKFDAGVNFTRGSGTAATVRLVRYES